MDVAEADSYACLREDWDGAYIITREPGTPEPYRAERRDDGTVLAAATPDELREAIRSDYHARPIPRDAAP
jgi:hypothetical protein